MGRAGIRFCIDYTIACDGGAYGSGPATMRVCGMREQSADADIQLLV